jgi:tetratricopeptide (TPR) repeat protein
MRSVAAFLRALAPIAVIGTLLLGGCGLLPDVIDETANWTPNKIYAEAKDAMAEGAYDKAIKYFEKLEARFPYGRYAQQAQLEVAYAYFRQNEPASAIAACERFIRLAPQPSQRRLRLLPEGPGNLQRRPGPARLCQHAGPHGARPQVGSRLLRRLQDTRHQVPRKPLHRRTPRRA